MSFAERILHAVNPLFRRERREASSYSEMQYGWASGDLELFEGGIDLRDQLVLDAGCGPGGKTIFYAERGPRKIIGIDRSPDHIDQARRFAELKGASNVEFRVAGLDAIPFEDNFFDAAIMSDVLEHVDRSLLAPAFKEIRRVLKPGGRLSLYFPPWTSFDASHLYAQIYVPWCQILFSDETLFRVLRRVGRGNPAQVEGAIVHYKELNRLTIDEFHDLVKSSGFKVASSRLKTIKNLPRTGIMLIDQYLTKRVVAVLEK